MGINLEQARSTNPLRMFSKKETNVRQISIARDYESRQWSFNDCVSLKITIYAREIVEILPIERATCRVINNNEFFYNA